LLFLPESTDRRSRRSDPKPALVPPPNKRVEDQEALQPSALVRELTDTVEGQVHDLLSKGVVAARVAVRRVLFLMEE
jgi:hypothetical protein